MINVAFKTTYDNNGMEKLRKDLEYTRETLASIQSDFEVINEGIEEGRWLENFARQAQSEIKIALDKSWDGLWNDATRTLSASLGDSVVDGFKHGFGNSSAIWDKAFDQLALAGDKAISKLVSSLADNIINFLGSTAWDNLLKPLGSWFGLDKGLGAITSWLGVGSAGAAATGAASAVTAGAGALGASGTGAAALGAMTDVGGYFVNGLSEFATSGMMDVGGYFGLGGASEFAAEGAMLAGGESAGLSGLLSGGSGSLLSVAGPIAATILGVELFAGAMDMEGPITAVMGALQGGGGHTQASALAYITADMEYLAVTTERVQTCLASAVDGVQGFGGSMLMEMAPATREMTILAETAGLSQQQLNAMIDALGPLQGKWIETSEVMATASGAIDRMSDTLSANNEFLVGCSSQADAFALMLTHLASSLELPEAPANALQATIGALVGQWQMGGLSAEDMSFKLKQAFAGALAEAADQADMTTERMRSLEESIRSIPTDWQTYISVVYEEHNKPSTLHSGGRVMHSGGWLANLPRFHSGAQVTNLAQDEVPIIARRGEYVVRAESVTAASLPWLAALNQSGKVPGAAQASPQVNLHLEVHGNILGNESGLEALARTLERKLREIQGGRFGYALG